ncbi:hypothetical protein BIV57_13130 [Mangrovactinospora gilvigrisea]|uniref:HTH tetR-type domain-containing protein n=1 Tax=Mangrovactinospora gilvigrisea TaxID=1428644 RepID=A0A1J7BEM6_9ACTN|nr:TetR/AcrR family transcriptional regulator [Mangrovactinospora gilvigrisea]OIV37029.1 hypothetical protein BIV57_13130 [Mangrovactinospora gilvigrisea]
MSRDDAAAKRARIVDAAVDVFSRYGFRRTSMELLADAADVSRPALYQHFRNKNDVFTAVAELVGDRMAQAARHALEGGSGTADRLHAVLSIKLETALGVTDSGHLAELVAEADTRAHTSRAPVEQRLADVLTEVITHADDLDPEAASIPPHDAAALLLDATAGIGRATDPPEVRRRRLRQLVDLTVRALGGATPRS